MANYIASLRKAIGHDPIMAVACGVLLVNEQNELLLQRRSDNGLWCTPGGSMELGETLAETLTREVYEETGLLVKTYELFGIYAGQDGKMVYPNQDVVYYTCVIFLCKEYEGQMIKENDETLELAFFSKDSLPKELNQGDQRWIADWKNGTLGVIVK